MSDVGDRDPSEEDGVLFDQTLSSTKGDILNMVENKDELVSVHGSKTASIKEPELEPALASGTVSALEEEESCRLEKSNQQASSLAAKILVSEEKHEVPSKSSRKSEESIGKIKKEEIRINAKQSIVHTGKENSNKLDETVDINLLSSSEVERSSTEKTINKAKKHEKLVSNVATLRSTTELPSLKENDSKELRINKLGTDDSEKQLEPKVIMKESACDLENKDIDDTYEILSKHLETSCIPVNKRLLARPPVRFIHDIALFLLPNALFEADECDSELVTSSKATKVSWLDKLRAVVEVVTGCDLSHVRVKKLVAGKETANTRFLLRMLCRARNVLNPDTLEDIKNTVLEKLKIASQCNETFENKAYYGKQRRATAIPQKPKPFELLIDTKAGGNAEPVSSFMRKLRIGISHLHIDVSKNLTVLSRIKINQAIINSPVLNNTATETSKHISDLEDQELLLEYHIRAQAAALHFADDGLVSTKSIYRRASSPVANSFNGTIAQRVFQQVKQVYLYPLVNERGDQLCIFQVPSILLDVSVFPTLQVLSLTGLNLTCESFPTRNKTIKLPNLMVLALSGNRLEDLPEIFQEMVSLEELRLDRNILQSLSCQKLTRLKRIDVSRNRIEAIPKDMLSNLKKLVVLNLLGNQLKAIPMIPESAENLQVLCMDENPLSSHEKAFIKQFGSDVVLLEAARKQASMKHMAQPNQPTIQTDESLDEFSKVNRSDDNSVLIRNDILDLRKGTELNTLKFDKNTIECVHANLHQLNWTPIGKSCRPGRTLQLIFSLRNLAELYVHSTYGFRSTVTNISDLHYLGCKPYDKDIDPPIYLPELHRQLSEGFHIINCSLTRNGKCCKFILLPIN